MPPETFGVRLQRLRNAAKLSQSEAAALAGVPVGTLRCWEQDRRMLLFLPAARALARALGVSLDELAADAVPGSPKARPKGRPPKKEPS